MFHVRFLQEFQIMAIFDKSRDHNRKPLKLKRHKDLKNKNQQMKNIHMLNVTYRFYEISIIIKVMT